MRAFEFLFEVSERVKQQLVDKFTSADDSVNAQEVRQYLDKWDQLLPIIPQNQRDIQRLSFDQLKQIIDDAETRKMLRGKNTGVSKQPKNALYADDGLEIYKGTGREQCIVYGDGYDWCISRKQADNMFYWYRIKDQSPMFYFVFDLDRDQDDDYHASVIHVFRNGNYRITNALNDNEFNATWEEIVKILPKLKPLKHLFKPEPLSSQERADVERFSEQLSDQEYRVLSLGEKYKYIQFRQQLRDQQQTDTPDELISVYAKLQPIGITKETYNRLKPNDQRYVVDKLNREDDPIAQLRSLLEIGIKPSEPVQLAAVKQQNGSAIKSIIGAGIKLSEPVQLAAVEQNGYLIRSIIESLAKEGSEPSKEVQLAAVKENPIVIGSIILAKITPIEEVQVAAVTENGHAIESIIKALAKEGSEPSEPVQLAAVQHMAYPIELIVNAGITPSKDVQLAAVQNHGGVIESIIKALAKEGREPIEQVQLAAVKQNGLVIESIIKAKIKPSEDVQLAAVTEDVHAIEYIIDALAKEGSEPSEPVQLAAVKKKPLVIRSIIDAGIKPSEPVQLAAVKKKPLLIRSIIRAGITPSERVKAAAGYTG